MIILTRPAIAAIENVLQREGKVAGGVRISATNGGCSGPNYEMAIESDPGPDDTVIEIRGVRLFVAAEKHADARGSHCRLRSGRRRFRLHLRKPRGGSREFGVAVGMRLRKSLLLGARPIIALLRNYSSPRAPIGRRRRNMLGPPRHRTRESIAKREKRLLA